MSGFASTRHRGPGSRPGARRSKPEGHDDPLNPDVVPGAAEDEMGDPESVARGICLRALTGAPKTRQQLADLLAQRGVPEDAAETVLDRFTEVGLIEAVSAVDDEDERAAARRLVERRAPGMRRLDRATATRRLMGMLARKGYNGGLAAAVVREVLDSTGSAGDIDDEFAGLDVDSQLP